MIKSVRIDRCFQQPVIPVISSLPDQPTVLAGASSVILQGFKVTELPAVVEAFNRGPLEDVRLLAHVDLITGLENNEAGLEFLAQFPRIEGVVTVHHHLLSAVKRLGFLSILRVFLSDSRALERGMKVIEKSRPDVVDLLPVAAAVKVAADFRSLRVPHITGGLCRTEADVREALAAGNRAVTSTRPGLWRMNG